MFSKAKGLIGGPERSAMGKDKMMMKSILALSLALGLAACAEDGPLEMTANDEARLASELRDYEQSGPTVSCVSQRDLEGNRSAGEGAIIFQARGSGVYVNRPRSGCPEMKHSRGLVTRTTSTRLCAGDIVRVVDFTSGFESGACGLGEFTPYKRRRI